MHSTQQTLETQIPAVGMHAAIVKETMPSCISSAMDAAQNSSSTTLLFSSFGVSLVSSVLVHIAKHHGREHNELLLMSQEEGTLGRLVFLEVWPRQGGQLA